MGGAGKAVVLLSGGVDSAVCLFRAVRDLSPESVMCLTFDWGQRSWDQEREAAIDLARIAGVERPRLVCVNFPYGGLLTDEDAQIPLDRTVRDIEEGGVAPTFFPGRNLVMLSHAFGIASCEGACAVYFGPNALDAAGYPDCRADFTEAMENTANLALGNPGIRLETPLARMSKADIVKMGEEFGVPWELTFSCYAPVERRQCGRCDSCQQRRGAFEAAGVADLSTRPGLAR